MSGPVDVVIRFLETFSTGNVAAILDALTDDATWWVAGRVPGISGTNDKEALGRLLAEVKPLYADGALSIWPLSVVVEGGRVACEAESRALLTDGRVYSNTYHFAFDVRGDRIARVREYSDTQHMLEIFGG